MLKDKEDRNSNNPYIYKQNFEEKYDFKGYKQDEEGWIDELKCVSFLPYLILHEIKQGFYFFFISCSL